MFVFFRCVSHFINLRFQMFVFLSNCRDVIFSLITYIFMFLSFTTFWVTKKVINSNSWFISKTLFGLFLVRFVNDRFPFSALFESLLLYREDCLIGFEIFHFLVVEFLFPLKYQSLNKVPTC